MVTHWAPHVTCAWQCGVSHYIWHDDSLVLTAKYGFRGEYTPIFGINILYVVTVLAVVLQFAPFRILTSIQQVIRLWAEPQLWRGPARLWHVAVYQLPVGSVCPAAAACLSLWGGLTDDLTGLLQLSVAFAATAVSVPLL
eukprot:CAMPEP_0119105004 /NCGR_PEP_ID=MMETSP1180-20130426/3078_1 /TAXON_ID=3052 ORGANISM="Chlamydomonas cf sp, Strain CCMP681" /NCGR_SAMPLE_ID=MMETSP1180 /ASSEMBLY_ACC=CAM_ASM_000741 /LENGTH=139 /DNA_ID=CAMNT_0007089925 /DNA_START=800 /DNA_END=1215 /DNA_ORIENTATION=+